MKNKKFEEISLQFVQNQVYFIFIKMVEKS